MIVEDGTGKPDANSYASVAFADLYFSTRNNPAWALLTTPQKEANLTLATDYIEAVYSQVFKGLRCTATQALSFPRKGVVVDGFDFPSNKVPVEIMNAACELALKAKDGALIKDQGRKVTSKKVADIQVTYSENSDDSPKYPLVDRLISKLTVASASGSGGLRVVPLVRG